MRENRRELGGRKERTAGAYLEEKGHVILAYNYRTRMAEADVVSKDGDTYVFTEVTPAKQHKVRMAALYYLEDRNLSPDLTPVRFDVIGILGDSLTHVENAF